MFQLTKVGSNHVPGKDTKDQPVLATPLSHSHSLNMYNHKKTRVPISSDQQLQDVIDSKMNTDEMKYLQKSQNQILQFYVKLPEITSSQTTINSLVTWSLRWQSWCSGRVTQVSLSGRIYAIGGKSSRWKDVDSVEIYDPDSNMWTQ